MSNRSPFPRQEKPNSNHHNNRGPNSNSNSRGKTQKIFVPKTSIPQSSSGAVSVNQPQTLSSSLRSNTVLEAQGSRVRLGEKGEWVASKGNFVNYLPQDEAVAIGLRADEGGFDAVESQRVVDLLNRELGTLLKLKPREFWRQVASDASLHEFLDSFLQFRSRWYDFPFHGAKGTVAGVIVGDLELSRRVFMVLYRISSHRDPGVRASDSLTKKDHEVLLQDKKLLDLPKLLDICALYSHDNEELTRSLVLNAIIAQPEILGSLTAMVSHFLGIVNTMYQRCRSSLEVLISAGGSKDHGPTRGYVEYLEVMDFLNDAVTSMNTFITTYRHAAMILSSPVDASDGNEELIYILAKLHDSLLPSLQQGLQVVLASKERDSTPVLSEISVSLKILSGRIVDLGWKLLENCYLGDELFIDNLQFPAGSKIFPASVEDPLIRADILIQCFREITAVSHQDSIGGHSRGTFLQNMDKQFQILHKIQTLQQSGWLSVDDEQYQYLAGILTHPIPSIPKRLTNDQNSIKTDGIQLQEDAAIAESKISQVKDLFPNYGNGFILACLEVYDHNPEEVIQRILEGTLHEDLKNLDTSMETLQIKPKQSLTKNGKGKGILTEPKQTLTKNDKGKGILTEPEPIIGFPTTTTSSSKISQNPIPKPFTGLKPSLPSRAGRFIRKDKNDQNNDNPLDSRDPNHMEKTAALLSQQEYEDEYDDSFDDLGMTIVESSVEETETLGERVKSRMSVSSRDESQSQGQGPAKWGSRRKPQFYVKDGKNYSYKVEGSVAVADEQQASIITQAQKETIHGLGRGGNRPLGAVRIWEEQNEVDNEKSGGLAVDGGGDDGGQGRGRGRGGRRGGGGGRNSNYRKDRAMKKHMASVSGF